MSAGAVTSVTDAASLAGVAAGDVVELAGEVVGNPLAQLLSLLSQVVSADDAQEEGVRLMLSMGPDLAAAPVRDLLLLADGGVTGVLTLPAAADGAIDALLFGRFRVLGKATRVLGKGEAINLTRRTSLGPDGAGDGARDGARVRRAHGGRVLDRPRRPGRRGAGSADPAAGASTA